MKRLLFIIVLTCGICLTANADVWMWVDANGKIRFVDTMKPIYTWIDEYGKMHYGDTLDYEDAASVELDWHARGTLDQAVENGEPGFSSNTQPDETDAERAAREKLCKRATEVYDSYLNAPQLYRTSESGEREILGEVEAATT